MDGQKQTSDTSAQLNGKLLLFIPQRLLREGYHLSSLLYPFWGLKNVDNSPRAEFFFLRYGFNPEYYALTEHPAEADYVLMPYKYWYVLRTEPGLIEDYRAEAQRLGKPLLIDAIGDSLKKIDIPEAVILRYSYYRRRLRQNEIIVPVHAEDMCETFAGSILTLREKGEKPVIGFAGWGAFSFFRYPRSYIKHLPLLIAGLFTTRFDLYKKGVLLRKQALTILQNSVRVDTNFLIRSSFSGNVKTAKGDPERLKKEFVENILHSDYTLCIRGDANQGTRFFEALSLGRIPLFVDTDIPLPLEHLINYREFCVFVDYRDLSRIDRIIADFHDSISPVEFTSMQRKARAAFETYLRMDSYTKYLMEILKKKAYTPAQ